MKRSDVSQAFTQVDAWTDTVERIRVTVPDGHDVVLVSGDTLTVDQQVDVTVG